MSEASTRDRVELVASILLAAATVGSAWCASQSSLWNGEQTRSLAAATSAQFASSRKATIANRNATIDVTFFLEYVTANLHGDTKVAEYLREHARPDFKPALEAWIADKEAGSTELKNPFVRPEYKVAETNESLALDARAASERVKANTANAYSDAFMLHTVYFALSLFFLGATTQARNNTIRRAMLVMGALAFAVAVVSMVRLPLAAPLRSGREGPQPPMPARVSLPEDETGVWPSLVLFGDLVQHEPVEAQLARRLQELLEVDRLAHEAVRAQAVAADDILVLVRRRQDHDGHALRARVGAQLAQHLEAVDLRQLEIEQHHLRERRRGRRGVLAARQQVIQRLDPIARDDRLVEDVGLLQGEERQLLVHGVVLDEQDDLGLHDDDGGATWRLSSPQYEPICRVATTNWS
jgi:hypothetical protein